jgi:hypothetical protein
LLVRDPHLAVSQAWVMGGLAVKWLVALAVALGLSISLPWTIAASKRSARGKGRLAGAAFAIGLAFGAIFDPAKSAAIENIQKKKDIGDEAEGDEGAPPA